MNSKLAWGYPAFETVISLAFQLADKMHPYILFSSNIVSMKICVGTHLVSQLSLFVYFSVLPSLLASSIYYLPDFFKLHP